jgi:large subunit ribosomal protein L15
MSFSLFRNSLIKYGSQFRTYSILNKPLITLNKNILELKSPLNLSKSYFSIESESKRLLNLNDMRQIPEAHKKRKRWGRGIGSGRGKNAGFGHQKSRVTPRAFEGGI